MSLLGEGNGQMCAGVFANSNQSGRFDMAWATIPGMCILRTIWSRKYHHCCYLALREAKKRMGIVFRPIDPGVGLSPEISGKRSPEFDFLAVKKTIDLGKKLDGP